MMVPKENYGLPNGRIQWTTIFIVVLTWLMSAVLTYGVISTKINYLEDRVKTDRKQPTACAGHLYNARGVPALSPATR